jgi:hypothetical protein
MEEKKQKQQDEDGKPVFRFKKNDMPAVVFMNLKGRKKAFIARCDMVTKEFTIYEPTPAAYLRRLGYEEIKET